MNTNDLLTLLRLLARLSAYASDDNVECISDTYELTEMLLRSLMPNLTSERLFNLVDPATPECEPFELIIGRENV